MLPRRPLSLLSALATLAVAGFSCAAEVGSEDFAGGAGTWIGQGAVGGVVQHVGSGSNAYMEVSLNPGGFPVPGIGGTLLVTNVLSGFIGDYAVAECRVVGFSFYAEDTLPSSLLLRWQSGSTNYVVDLTASLVGTGQWHVFALSLFDRSAGPWEGSGTDEGFEPALANVTSLSIQVVGAGTALQRYRLDDIFLTRLPRLTGLAPEADSVRLTVAGLEAGREYRVLRRDTPQALPADAGTFVAIAPFDEVLVGPEVNTTQADYYVQLMP